MVTVGAVLNQLRRYLGIASINDSVISKLFKYLEFAQISNWISEGVRMSSAKENYALVTGATSGIGYELAKLFAEHNYNLVLVGRNEAQLKLIANELTEQFAIIVIPMVKDLFNRESPFELYDEIKQQGICVDVLVNDIDQCLYGRFTDTDIRKELDMLQLNIGACLVLTKLFLRQMTDRRKGKILNMASIEDKVSGSYQSVYHGTKAFIHAFTEAIRAEIAHSGVTISCLLRDVTQTDYFQKAREGNSTFRDQEIAELAEVARDGFNALMDDEDITAFGTTYKTQNFTDGSKADKAAVKRDTLKTAKSNRTLVTKMMSRYVPRNSH